MQPDSRPGGARYEHCALIMKLAVAKERKRDAGHAGPSRLLCTSQDLDWHGHWRPLLRSRLFPTAQTTSSRRPILLAFFMNQFVSLEAQCICILDINAKSRPRHPKGTLRCFESQPIAIRSMIAATTLDISSVWWMIVPLAPVASAPSPSFKPSSVFLAALHDELLWHVGRLGHLPDVCVRTECSANYTPYTRHVIRSRLTHTLTSESRQSLLSSSCRMTAL
jgi:hypothetical protein